LARHFFLRPAAATLLALVAGHAVGATPLAPVQPGLWHLTAHTSFDPDPQPGGTSWPFMPGKPRDRDEDICLSDSRAREPMPAPSANGLQAVLVAPDTLAASAPAAGKAGGLAEWRYRRVDATAFEGHWRLANAGMGMSLDYQARFVSSDCGAVRPSSPSRFGEP
jgi:hypothetical protein